MLAPTTGLAVPRISKVASGTASLRHKRGHTLRQVERLWPPCFDLFRCFLMPRHELWSYWRRSDLLTCCRCLFGLFPSRSVILSVPLLRIPTIPLFLTLRLQAELASFVERADIVTTYYALPLHNFFGICIFGLFRRLTPDSALCCD